MLKLLGFADICVAMLLVMTFWVSSWRLPLIITIYVAIKCAAFKSDLWSWIDLVMGLSAWFFIFNPSFFVLIPSIYFLQKGVMSFF